MQIDEQCKTAASARQLVFVCGCSQVRDCYLVKQTEFESSLLILRRDRRGGRLTDGMPLLYNKALRNPLAARWLQLAGPPTGCPRVGKGVSFWSRQAGEGRLVFPIGSRKPVLDWPDLPRPLSTSGKYARGCWLAFLAPAAYERERGGLLPVRHGGIRG